MTDWSKIIPESYIYTAFGLLVTVFGGFVVYTAKKAIGALKGQWSGAMDKLSIIENTTRVQAENHLNTIQQEAVKQTDLLGTMIKEQATTNGYLKAVVDLGKR